MPGQRAGVVLFHGSGGDRPVCGFQIRIFYGMLHNDSRRQDFVGRVRLGGR